MGGEGTSLVTMCPRKQCTAGLPEGLIVGIIFVMSMASIVKRAYPVLPFELCYEVVCNLYTLLGIEF